MIDGHHLHSLWKPRGIDWMAGIRMGGVMSLGSLTCCFADINDGNLVSGNAQNYRLWEHGYQRT